MRLVPGRRNVSPTGTAVPHVLIVGAGFAGFDCARELERRMRAGEVRVTMASPTDYMLYSPLLPHVSAGILKPADIAVPLRRTLRHTLRAPCRIVGVDLTDRVCIAHAIDGREHAVHWDRPVLCPGAVIRTFAIPGLERYGRGMKSLAEASYLHDHVLAELELANTAQRQGIVLARNILASLRGEPLRVYRHRDLGLVVDLGGTRSVARPLGRNLAYSTQRLPASVSRSATCLQTRPGRSRRACHPPERGRFSDGHGLNSRRAHTGHMSELPGSVGHDSLVTS